MLAARLPRARRAHGARTSRPRRAHGAPTARARRAHGARLPRARSRAVCRVGRVPQCPRRWELAKRLTADCLRVELRAACARRAREMRAACAREGARLARRQARRLRGRYWRLCAQDVAGDARLSACTESALRRAFERSSRTGGEPIAVRLAFDLDIVVRYGSSKHRLSEVPTCPKP